MKLWHCNSARSLRPLWALEEMQFEYELEVLPFPPRALHKEFLGTNKLGTVPYFVDGEVKMTESTGICQYLVDRYQKSEFGIAADHPEYGGYLNWLHQSDATLTFPLTLSLRYLIFEPGKADQVGIDYARWHIARLRMLDEWLLSHQYLCDERFTIADIAVAYALFLGEVIGVSEHYSEQTKDYLARMMQRPAFIRAQARTPDEVQWPKIQLPDRG